jgi:carbon storage regulator
MLVFTRRKEQCFRIGDDIIVKVLSLSPYEVRLGITAPKEIPVHREEVYEQLKGQEGENG